MQYQRFRAMNTNILLATESPYPAQTFEMAQEFIQQSEERFTRFKATSELAALNHSAGHWFNASPDMLDVLIAALECHQATDGIFDPSILPDLQAAGYTQSFDHLLEHGPASAPPRYSRTWKLPFSNIEIDSLRGRIRLPKEMQIDLGGIAKGWIAEKATRLMARSSTACAVNAGGDMFLMGKPYGQKVWEIALEDPRDSIQDLMILHVEDGAVTTSSVVKRAWQQGDNPRHHLIDPRTGEPAKTSWLSVTVFAPRAVLAETFAKAILIAGPAHVQPLLDKNPNISYIAVDADGQLWNPHVVKEKVYEYA